MVKMRCFFRETQTDDEGFDMSDAGETSDTEAALAKHEQMLEQILENQDQNNETLRERWALSLSLSLYLSISLSIQTGTSEFANFAKI